MIQAAAGNGVDEIVDYRPTREKFRGWRRSRARPVAGRSLPERTRRAEA